MIAAGTGHRIEKIGDRIGVVEAVTRSLILELRPDHIISGMATGFDQTLARVARDLAVPWTAAIPFPGQHLRWPQEAQDEYHKLLESASAIEIVSQSYEGPWVMQRRNVWMVDRCDFLVACWDGSEDGGTANCLKYAERIGREVKYLDWK